MVGLPGRSRTRAPGPPQTLTSRLLPAMLDEKRLAAVGTLNILDFGRAHGASLEFFNQYSCRLCVLDAADSLIGWSRDISAREDDDLPSASQMQLELSNLLSAMGEHRYDFVFLWDTINHLPEHALPAFAALLRRHVTAQFRGHGFVLQKRGAAQQLRHMSLTGINEIVVHEASETELYPHNRRVINDCLGSELKLDQGVLHGDGRLEFLMLNGSPNPS
ncbi:MAG: methyltransferase domain-containing protein [Pseudomonadota bacterium]